tara:strand:- start:2797 stop:3627 length:831 start_codon:yes stop_codon:yes gene_type:complete
MKKLLYTILIFFISFLFYFIFNLKHKNSNETFENNYVFFAHRGVPYFVENTEPSFKESLHLGFHCLETDLNFTKDGKIIVFHDNDTKRLLDTNVVISNTNWNDLNKLEFKHDTSNQKLNILLFEDFLKKNYDFSLYYLDIKVSPTKKLANQLISDLSKVENLNSYLVADANILFLSYLKFKNPKINTVLEGFKNGKEWYYYLIPIRFRPDYLASNYKDNNEYHISFLKRHNLINNKIIYGISSEEISNAIKKGFKYFIVDYDSTTASFLNQLKVNQ